LQDEFSVHFLDSVKNKTKKLGAEVDIIPGGFTGSAQVLDKGVNKPFKGYLRGGFEEWMCMNGLRHRLSRAEVAQWFTRAWSQVVMATIINNLKSIGHKAVVADDDEDSSIHSNQPGAGQENTTDEEADDSVLHQMEEEGEAPTHLLSSNTTLTMMTMSSPLSWT
jgi:hypothetical protein